MNCISHGKNFSEDNIMACLLASFNTAYVADIVCALILIISAFIGAKKGFVKCFFGFVSTLVALLLAFLLASTVTGWLSSVFGADGSLTGKLEDVFLKWKGFDADISAQGIEAALESVNLPGFIKDAIADKIGEISNVAPGTTLAAVAAPVASRFIGLLICGIVIFIVAKILLFLLEKILTKIVNSWSVASALNGVLGFAVGFLKAAIFVCAILAVLSLIPSEGLVTFFDQTLFLKYLYNDNPLTKLLSTFI